MILDCEGSTVKDHFYFKTKNGVRKRAKLAVKLNLAITVSWWLFLCAESEEEAPREAGQNDGYLYLSKTAW